MITRRRERPFIRRGVSSHGAAKKAVGLRFATTASHAIGVGGDMNFASKWFRFVGAVGAPQNAFRIAAGTSTGGGVGLSFCSETLPGFASGNLVGWFGRYTTSIDSAPSANLPIHVPRSTELQRLFVKDWVLDTVNNLVIEYTNGRRVCVHRGAAAKASWATTNAMAINRSPGGVSSQYGDVTVCELQWSTTGAQATDALTDAMVRAVSHDGVIGGAARRWTMSSPPVGATWTDVIGGKALTITGSPSAVSLPVDVRAIGQILFAGDSEGVRVFDGTREGDGYRRDAVIAIAAAGIAYSCDGFYNAGTYSQKDFDTRHLCLPGQALGVANGATASRLSTLAADLVAYVSTDGAVALNYGTNDAFVRCGASGMGMTATDGRDAFLTDLDSALAIIGARMDSGRPIEVWAPPQVGDAAAGFTAAYNDMLIGIGESLRSGWVTSRQATYPGLRLADVDGALTAGHGSDYRNDTGVLVDHTHFADAVQPLVGGEIASALLGAA